MQASYPSEVAPQFAHEPVLPAEDWSALFLAVLDRLRAAVASERADTSVRACVLDCVDALESLHHTLPNPREGTAP